jgi:hypothetical protein
VIRILTLLLFGSVCFAAGVAYDMHAQNKAREILLEQFLHSHVFQSAYPLPARILRP